ncbi:MAG: hypothetical protein K1X56_03100 [Flavobacteriales bacterium]|nr:hypothetical protein [Flavobacteriales bacterium]
MLKRLAIFSLSLLALPVMSQMSTFYRLDVGGGFGVSNYLGEIGGKEKTERPFVWDMKLNQTRWNVGGFARFKMNNYYSLRADLVYGRIQGADSLSTNRGRVGRNLSFRNDMLELSARAEVYLYNTNDVGNRGWYRVDFKSYAFAGVGGLLHGPKALYNGEWVKLRPLETEGVKYGKITAVVPVGVGFFFTYKRQHRFGWEAGWRLTFTDYLDDISTVYADPSIFGGNQTAIDLANRSGELTDQQRPSMANYAPGQKRGDSNDNDTYFYSTFTYSYVFRGKNPFYTQHYSWLGGRKGRRTLARVKF